LDLDPKAFSSRLVSFTTSSLRLFNFFSVRLPTRLFLHFPSIFFTVECYKCVSMRNLYFNLLNENYSIMHKWWCYQQGKYRFNVDSPFLGWQRSLFMDFRNLMTPSHQRGDPCPTLLKFELLINLSTFNSSQFPFVNHNSSDSYILCDHYLPPHGLEIQDATCRPCHGEITQGKT
jgi:hypothetical protein